MFGFADFLLLLNEKCISIFECVFSPTFKGVHNLRPFLLAIVAADECKQLNILLYLPGTFFDLRVEVAIPVLSALFSTSEYFIQRFIELILSLGDCFPVDSVRVHSWSS